MLYFPVDIIVNYLLLNCFIYFKKVIKSENIF